MASFFASVCVARTQRCEELVAVVQQMHTCIHAYPCSASGIRNAAKDRAFHLIASRLRGS